MNQNEMTMIQNWLHLHTGSSSGSTRHSNDVLFSFLCGSRSSREWVKPESSRYECSGWKNGKRLHTLTWDDTETELTCIMELTEFNEFPALEWIVRLRYNGTGETEPITNFKALDTTWNCAGEGEIPELRRTYGSDARHDDFECVTDELKQSMWDKEHTIRIDNDSNNAFRKVRNGSATFFQDDSRSSATWLPFFNLCTESDGLIMAIGWSGRWFAEFTHDGKGSTAVSAGMEHLELRLRHGEEIRSPRIVLLYWQGAPINGQNIWRQLVLHHYSPFYNGHPAQVPICNGSWGGTPTPDHLDAINRIEDNGLKYDYYWMDAGWYGSSTKPCPNVFDGEWQITGDWQVNPLYHPKGLKPVSNAVRKAGMKFLLWIEPERATYGTPVTLEHPEWFLRKSNNPPEPDENMLLNFAHPEAWQWAVETVSGLIIENGIECYREDFNMDPGPFWDAADEEGRKGLLEIRFIEGLYAFWDELRKRHPELLIDNCASGGRRLELETISRSVALWRTDYNCFPHTKPEASQTHTAGLQLWVPLNCTSSAAKPGDTYQVRSAYSAGLVFSLNEFGINDYSSPDINWEWYRSRIDEARRLRPYFNGDFYPLTPNVFNLDAWLVYQLILPEEQKGALLAFRRPMSGMTSGCFCLNGLNSAETYEFEDADSGKIKKMKGEDLLTQGLPLSIDTPRTSQLFFFSPCE